MNPVNDPLVKAAASVYEGPIVWHLQRGEWEAAHRWAQASRATQGVFIEDHLHPALGRRLEDISLSDLPHKYHAQHVSLTALTWGPVLDLQSTDELRRLATAEGIEAHVRRAAAGVALVRLVALERFDEAHAWLPKVAESYPELRADIARIQQASSAAERRFLLARMLLARPGFVLLASRTPEFWRAGVTERPRALTAASFDGVLGVNWWCSLDLSAARRDAYEWLIEKPTNSQIYAQKDVDPEQADAIRDRLADTLLSSHPLFSTIDETELRRLSSIPPAYSALGREVFAWMDQSRADRLLESRAEEISSALHWVVKSTRWGCPGLRSGSVSREANRRLHDAFPGSAWAQRTPYLLAPK